MKTIAGIDPGLTGAVAFIDSYGYAEVHDAPVVNRDMNASGMADLLKGWVVDLAIIERVGAMPKQGVSSTFKFGFGCGVWRGVLAALEIPVVLVTPTTWKSEFHLCGKPKDASREVALQLFPSLSSELARKKDHGRADALLLAEWGRRHDAGTLRSRAK